MSGFRSVTNLVEFSNLILQAPKLKMKADDKIFMYAKVKKQYVQAKLYGEFKDNIKSKVKQYRSRWGGSLWAASSGSTLFADSAISFLTC